MDVAGALSNSSHLLHAESWDVSQFPLAAPGSVLRTLSLRVVITIGGIVSGLRQVFIIEGLGSVSSLGEHGTWVVRRVGETSDILLDGATVTIGFEVTA